jgi:hypothetical protein
VDDHEGIAQQRRQQGCGQSQSERDNEKQERFGQIGEMGTPGDLRSKNRSLTHSLDVIVIAARLHRSDQRLVEATSYAPSRVSRGTRL